jgi:hypothetical protein
MAEKRMFTQKIIDSDAFLDMPLSTQALYFHLNMRADDDGFVNNPKRIQRTVGASEDDLKLLIAKRFLICFENGVIVIKHWRMHNTLKSDRYRPTQYQEEYALLEIKGNKAYTERQDIPVLPDGDEMEPDRNQAGSTLEPQYSIDKNSIDKEKNIYVGVPAEQPGEKRASRKVFSPPTVEEVREYCAERGNFVDPETFVDFYESKGWVVGKTKMKDWKAAVRTWERSENRKKGGAVKVTVHRRTDLDDIF